MIRWAIIVQIAVANEGFVNPSMFRSSQQKLIAEPVWLSCEAEIVQMPRQCCACDSGKTYLFCCHVSMHASKCKHLQMMDCTLQKQVMELHLP